MVGGGVVCFLVVVSGGLFVVKRVVGTNNKEKFLVNIFQNEISE